MLSVEMLKRQRGPLVGTAGKLDDRSRLVEQSLLAIQLHVGVRDEQVVSRR
jgi:hypothetical protein